MTFTKLSAINETAFEAIDHAIELKRTFYNQATNVRLYKDNKFIITITSIDMRNNDALKYAHEHNLLLMFSNSRMQDIALWVPIEYAHVVDNEIGSCNFTSLTGVKGSSSDLSQLQRLVTNISKNSGSMLLDIEFTNESKISGSFTTHAHTLCAVTPRIYRLVLSKPQTNETYATNKIQDSLIDFEHLTLKHHTPELSQAVAYLDDRFNKIILDYCDTLNKNKFIDDLLEAGYEDIL